MSNLQKYKQRIAKNKALAKNILHITANGFVMPCLRQTKLNTNTKIYKNEK